jgi:hypothetical protein
MACKQRVPVMKATKKMPNTAHRIPEIFPHVDSMQVAVVLSQYRHIYNRAAGEVIGYLKARDRSIHSCTVHRTRLQPFRGNAAISRHLSRRSLSAVAVQRESLKPDMGT